MGRLDEVTAVPDSVPDVCESAASERIFNDGLLFQSSYLIGATGADEDRSAQKAAAWVKSPVTFDDAFAADAGYLRSEVVWSICLRRWLLFR